MPMVAILVVNRTSHTSFLKSNKETKIVNCDHLFSNRDEMMKSYRANQKQELHMAVKFVSESERHHQINRLPSIDACHQIATHMAKRF
jgi:fatty acid/phospholipid biosynthesis enzyme